MKKMLVKVKDATVVERLYQFGEVETISNLFNIYSLDLLEKDIEQLKRIDGVLKVEEDECFELQHSIF